MEIQANRLDRGFFRYQKEFENKALHILRSGRYVLGEEAMAFEKEFSKFTDTQYCIGLASGLDSLWIAFKILGIGVGDEVLVQGNTYIASVMGITINGATPIFVEPDEYYNIDASKIEEKITEHTKAILVVHLYGQASNMSAVMEIASRHNLRVVEDCAQSHNAYFEGKMTGAFGDIGCFSFYPSKNLGAFGDAGAIITNDKRIAEDVRVYRNYGSEKRYYNKVVGTNSRLDELQAGLLRVRLSHLKELEIERTKICKKYLDQLDGEKYILPKVRKGASHVWHQFVIRSNQRDKLIDYLKKNNIGSIIHYPIPPHLSEAYAYLGYGKNSFPITEKYAKTVLSLPLYIGMTEEEQEKVIDTLNAF